MIAKLLYDMSMAMGYKNPELPVYETFKKQTATDRITTGDVRDIIFNTTGLEVICPFDNSDASYKLVDIQKLKIFAAKNNLARYKYIKTERDCDDFEFMFQGDVTHWDSDLACGMIWGIRPDGHGHAWNWCIGTDNEVWFIEPQGNHVFKPDKLWKITLLMM